MWQRYVRRLVLVLALLATLHCKQQDDPLPGETPSAEPDGSPEPDGSAPPDQDASPGDGAPAAPVTPPPGQTTPGGVATAEDADQDETAPLSADNPRAYVIAWPAGDTAVSQAVGAALAVAPRASPRDPSVFEGIGLTVTIQTMALPDHAAAYADCAGRAAGFAEALAAPGSTFKAAGQPVWTQRLRYCFSTLVRVAGVVDDNRSAAVASTLSDGLRAL